VKTVRRMLARARSDEAGISLIEIIVALMVFMIIATGVAYSMLAVLRSTADSRNRQQAVNLATQEIDLDRAISNLFQLQDKSVDTTINGTVFHIDRQANWFSNSAVNQNCGAGGGVLQYKQVVVTVTWSGMLSTTSGVKLRTLIDPGTRLNDPSLGTILVSVITAAGTASPGVTVTATPSSTPNGAVNITTPITATDTQGCTYILQVTPGNYDVTVSKAGYLDVNQSATSTTTVGVVASAAASVGFQFDAAASFPLAYAANYTAVPAPQIPTNLETSFLSTYGTFVNTAPVSPQSLYPFASGYQVVAGGYTDPSSTTAVCSSFDPGAWLAGPNAAGVAMAAGVRPAAAAALPGQTAAAAPVDMGVIGLTGLVVGQYLTAIQTVAPSAIGDPGCGDPATTLTFGQATSSTATLALPYGTWTVYTSSTPTGTKTAVPAGSSTVLNGGSVGATGLITLDPRTVAP
jgi:type II secretory pathway pseudopilin PulG